MKSVQIILVVLAAVCSSSMATMVEGDVPQVNALRGQESRFEVSIEALNEEEVSNVSVSCREENIVSAFDSPGCFVLLIVASV
jgi:hypothetical protein